MFSSSHAAIATFLFGPIYALSARSNAPPADIGQQCGHAAGNSDGYRRAAEVKADLGDAHADALAEARCIFQ